MKIEKDIVETIRAEGQRDLFNVIMWTLMVVIIMAVQGGLKIAGLFPFSWFAVFWPIFAIGAFVCIQFFGFLLFDGSCVGGKGVANEKS